MFPESSYHPVVQLVFVVYRAGKSRIQGHSDISSDYLPEQHTLGKIIVGLLAEAEGSF